MDNEIKGEGNSINYTFRMHDPRVGRFFAIDLKEKMYAWNSPYSFASNRVIRYIELEGLETYDPFEEEFGNEGAAMAKVTASTVIAGYEAVGNGMLWTLEAFWSDETEAKYIRETLKKSGVIVSSDISASQLADMFTFKKQFRDVELDFEKGFWGQAAGLGLGMLDILSIMSPVKGGGGTALMAKTSLTLSPGNFLRSSGGLLYGFGSKHGTRLAHVLDHTSNNLGKKFHGVFKTDNIIGTIDEAWDKVKAVDPKKWDKSLGVGGSETVDGITRSIREVDGEIYESFIVDLKKVIGYEGGKLGSGKDLTKVLISVKKNTEEVITAFPSN